MLAGKKLLSVPVSYILACNLKQKRTGWVAEAEVCLRVQHTPGDGAESARHPVAIDLFSRPSRPLAMVQTLLENTLIASLGKTVIPDLAGLSITVESRNLLGDHSVIADVLLAELIHDVRPVGAATDSVKLFTADPAKRVARHKGVDGPAQPG